MSDLLKNRLFLTHLSLFFVFNVCLYLFILFNHSRIPFHLQNYLTNSHHYLPDPRLSGQPFNLFSALAQYDSQWFLKVAIDGYTFNPNAPPSLSDQSMQNVIYNFSPLYPILLKTFSLVIPNLEIAAFALSNLLLISSFAGLYLFVKQFYPDIIAIKTAWLVCLFPYSIFFRSYYTESTYLLLSLGLTYSVIRNKFFLSSILTGLLNILKSRSLPLNLLLLGGLYLAYRQKKIKIHTLLMYISISLIPLLIWIVFNFVTTGDPFFFKTVISAWRNQPYWVITLQNLLTVANYFNLRVYDFHYSLIDVSVFFLSSFLLIKSRHFLRPELWWFSFLTVIFPLLIVDFMSYSRYQSVNFPLFIFLSSRLNHTAFIILAFLFTVLLGLSSLYFVNWHWIG